MAKNGKLRKYECLERQAKDIEVVQAYVPRAISRQLRKLATALGIRSDDELREELRWVYGTYIVMGAGVKGVPEIEKLVDWLQGFSLLPINLADGPPRTLITVQIDLDKLTRELKQAGCTIN